MRPLVLASLLAGFVSLALPSAAGAAPVPAFAPASPSAVAQDPSVQKAYWYWWHGRRYWRPGYWRPYYVGPGYPPPYYHRYWHRRWYGGGWHYW